MENNTEFEQKYFDSIYGEDSLIDGTYNSKEHARYLHSVLDLMEIEVNSIIDFAHGSGELLKDIVQIFKPEKCSAIDISTHVHNKLNGKKWTKDILLLNQSMLDFKVPKTPYDLGISNSIHQYLEDKDVEKALKIISKSCRYCYLHIPTESDYVKMFDQTGFKDPYSNKRSNEFYQKLVKKYFTFVSWGLVESKEFVNSSGSPFFDSLFRF